MKIQFVDKNKNKIDINSNYFICIIFENSKKKKNFIEKYNLFNILLYEDIILYKNMGGAESEDD